MSTWRFKTAEEFGAADIVNSIIYWKYTGTAEVPRVFWGKVCSVIEMNGQYNVMAAVKSHLFSESFSTPEWVNFAEAVLVLGNGEAPVIAGKKKCTCDSRELFLSGCKCGGI
jgi:hypothetical protein